MRATYFAFVPAMSAIVGTLGLSGGAIGVIFMALIGAGSGFFLAAIVAAILEWMALILITTTNQPSALSHLDGTGNV
jgi:outer membrane lipoprotein SlyB